MTISDEACTVCRRGERPVCPRCRQRMADEIHDLPRLWNALQTALVPGPGGAERLAPVMGEAPTPARLAALTLIAGGSDDARCLFVPAVRIWSTADGWRREPVHDAAGRTVMALVDDQSGVLPLREWLRAWAYQWRRVLGHSTADPAPARAGRRKPSTDPANADDPVATDWERRWPVTDWGPATRAHHRYLATWLDTVCDEDPHVGDFAASLRTLTGAVRAALLDGQDLEYLGRCPEDVDDRLTGTASVCGAQIWHDPYASVITCPRCHTETGTDQRIWLARRILDAWPIDRRRRYPRGLIEALRLPTCTACGRSIAVEWIGATERADREPFWRPGSLACPAGCDVT